MAHSDALDRLVRQVTTQVRWRRAEHYGLRGLCYGAIVAIAPLVPVPSGRFFERISQPAADDETKERGDAGMVEERARPFPRDPLKRPAFEERDFAQRGATGAPATAGDLSAIFKDTSLA